MPNTEEKMRREHLYARELKKRASEEREVRPSFDELRAEFAKLDADKKKNQTVHEYFRKFDWAPMQVKPLDKGTVIINDTMGPEEIEALHDEILAPQKKAVKAFSYEEAPEKGHLSAEILVYYPRVNKNENGYEDNTFHTGVLEFINIKDLLAKFFITAHSEYGKVGNWRDFIIGVTSDAGYLRGSLGKHVPILDYDGKNIKIRIRKDVKRLQAEFGLGPAWVYKTRGGFHVYFFADQLTKDRYLELIQSSNCCEGFKAAVKNRGYGVLRVSAKYGDFDIAFEYVLPSDSPGPHRMGTKGRVVEALIALGQECGTHLAILYPQWAHYRGDYRTWRPPKKKGASKKPQMIIHKIDPSKIKLQDISISKAASYGYDPGASTSKTYYTASNVTNPCATTSTTLTYNKRSTWADDVPEEDIF